METVIEKECSALGGLFQAIIGDMKGSYPVWEDFVNKASKLQSQLRTTVVATAAFLDAFQKVADLATSSRGATRDIGSALTRMCMRHRSIEARLRQLSMALIDCLVNPLQDQIEDWKKGANSLDKDHAKEYKKARQEIKKKSSDTLKLQKKAKKVLFPADALGRGDLQPQLDSALQDVSDKYLLLEETEKQAVRKALVEERTRFCSFVSMLRPVLDEEACLLGEITHLQTIADDLKCLTIDPHKLPPASEQVLHDLKGSDYNWTYHTPPASPNNAMSRKSSMCSSLNSVTSSDSSGRSSGSYGHSPSPHYRYRSCTLPPHATSARLASISSHDSGFLSHDTGHHSKSPSPMPAPADTGTQLTNGFDHYGLPDSLYLNGSGPTSSLTVPSIITNGNHSSGIYPSSYPPPASPSSSSCSSSSTLRSWSRPISALVPDYPHYCTLGAGGMLPSSKVPSWKDWAKPGPYDQPMVNTLRRKKESAEGPPAPALAHAPAPAAAPALVQQQRTRSGSSTEDSPRAHNTPMHKPQPVEESDPHAELSLALSCGLQLDPHHPHPHSLPHPHPQGSSRDSLHCSSGYSTQTNTPCCSEDTIPSQMSDYDYFSMGGEPEEEQQDFDKSSTVPRNSDLTQSYRRMFQAKRPASTAGVPSSPSHHAGPNHTGPIAAHHHHGSNAHGPVIITPGVATIRRTPSTKPSGRRATISAGERGPIPIKTPVIPPSLKTPGANTTTMGHDGLPSLCLSQGGTSPGKGMGMYAGMYTGMGMDDDDPASPESPLSGGEELGILPVSSWSGQASTNPPVALGQVGKVGQQMGEVMVGVGVGGMLVDGMDSGLDPQGDTMLMTIRRGVKLKRTLTNDRSAPRIA
ncbi:protein MTSS 1-like isoform X2 [Engraulis encrasicolus]|uniref:protein MTSS 1-like isoform X2 n=1 Tax=Engraulis encrasicolus TaxID=184585 RepID=UPI002FCF9C5E